MAEAEQVLIPDTTPAAPPETKARKPNRLADIIPSQLSALRQYHRAVLDTGDVDAVHKMRVTTRRLQASLDLLEREMNVRKLKKRLRSWRRALSQVRNYDVFLDLIEKEATVRRRAHREQFELVKGILQERRRQKADKVRKYLAAANINQIGIGLGLVAIPELSTEAAADADDLPTVPPAPDLAPQTLVIDEARVAGYAAERLDQRLAEFQALVAKSHPTADPAELHQLRIAAKRVRYLLEIVEQMGYGDASHALRWLRGLQDRIGDWHDLEALEAETISIVARGRFMREHLVESSRILQAAAHLRKKKETLVSRLFPVKVPRTLIQTSQRIARALRRRALRNLRDRHSAAQVNKIELA